MFGRRPVLSIWRLELVLCLWCYKLVYLKRVTDRLVVEEWKRVLEKKLTIPLV